MEVEFRFGAAVASLDELTDFHAVFVATGAGGDAFGLLESWDCGIYATREPRVFLGGMLTGSTAVEAIAEGAQASKSIEHYLQTGKNRRVAGDYQKEACARYLTHEGVVRVPRVVASGGQGFTAEEAQAEAARCLQCDCDACIAGCEMLRRYKKDPKKLAVEAHGDMAVSPFASRTLTREAYSCNLCGHCTSVCPEDVDIGALLRLSRAARVNAGVAPGALHDFWMRELEFAATEGAFASAPAGKTTCEYAFYPGCQLGAGNPEHVLRAYDVLAADLDMGVILNCCGSPAYWAGDDARVQAHVAETRRVWEGLGKPTLVFACATCSMMLGAFLPGVPRVSVYELLAKSGAIKPAAPFAEAAVFDPCNARDDTGMEAAVRELARAAGVDVHELPEKNRCCGHGGHIRVANPALYEEIVRAPGGGRRAALPGLLRQLPRRVRLAGQGVRPHPGRGPRPGDGHAGPHPRSEAGQQPPGEEAADETAPGDRLRARPPRMGRSRPRHPGGRAARDGREARSPRPTSKRPSGRRRAPATSSPTRRTAAGSRR